jgi:hypothetical protein
MINSLKTSISGSKIPQIFIWCFVIVSVTPFLLNVVGFDFGIPQPVFNKIHFENISKLEIYNSAKNQLKGLFIYAIMKYISLSIMLFVVLATLLRYYTHKEIHIIIIGFAMLFSSIFDGLIFLPINNSELYLPFIWTVSCFVYLILIISAFAIILYTIHVKIKKLKFLGATLFVAIFSTAFINYSSLSQIFYANNFTPYLFGFLSIINCFNFINAI